MNTTGLPQLKALFSRLVTVCGGVEVCATVLGISHQRVSQLQVLGNAEAPNLLNHIIPLEHFCGQAVVTGALAKLVEPAPAKRDPMTEAVEVVGHTAKVISLVSSGGSRREITAAVDKLKDEADDIVAALGTGEVA